MVTPADLLDLGRELARVDTETAWRSAASRAYYAAFHHCRALVTDRVGLEESGTAEDHGRVSAGLRQFDELAAEMFGDLRMTRNRADYEVDTLFSRGSARVALDVATRLLQLQ